MKINYKDKKLKPGSIQPNACELGSQHNI